LGDVLWYLAQVCNDCDIDLEAVARENLDKLRDRQERGVLKGSGGER
jgi:NTP pyrophosphatase (non-canonical NTP hydrolase)